MRFHWKRLVAAIVLAGGLSSVAIADGYEPVGKGFAPPPTPSWTGFYVGAQIGASANEAETACDGPCISSRLADAPLTNVLAGVYGGYNFQHGKFVFGVEGDINGTFGEESWSFGQWDAIETGYEVEQDFYASIRARAGVLATQNLLVFGTGGVAFADYKLHNPTSPDRASWENTTVIDDTLTGWVLGGGLEYALSNKVHIKAEYLHTEFEDSSRSYTPEGIFSRPVKFDTDLVNDQIRVGISVKSGPEADGVAVADGYGPVGKGFAPPAPSWTGFYVGAQVGASANEAETTCTPINGCLDELALSPRLADAPLTNVLAGVYGGYNFQHGKFVFGVEGDINGTFGQQSWSFGRWAPGTENTGYEVEQDFYASLRARAGVLATQNLLVFGTGGVAFADYKLHNPTCPDCARWDNTTVIDDTFTGWVVGGGLEYALSNKVHVKAEYLHTEFGDASRSYTPERISSRPVKFDTDLVNDQIRVGISVKSGPEADGVAVADGYGPVGKGFAPPAPSWTGFYVGAQVGASANEAEGTCDGECVQRRLADVPLTNVLAGVYGGYNFQHGKFVFGVEGDINGTFGQQSWNFGEWAAIDTGYEVEQDFYASLRARAGVLATQDLLVFGTGGVAFADYKLHNPTCPAGPGCAPWDNTTVIDDTLTGWVVGGGLEYALNSRLHFKAEYLHTEFEDTSRSYPIDDDRVRFNSDLENDQIRVGISVKSAP